MGNGQTDNKTRDNQMKIEHPRFAKARLTIDKKVVLEQHYNEQQFTEMSQKIHSINPQGRKIPLLLPQMEMTHT
mgnify:CR=1 FL=1